MTWDLFHDLSSAVLVLTVFLLLDSHRRLRRRIAELERKRADT